MGLKECENNNRVCADSFRVGESALFSLTKITFGISGFNVMMEIMEYITVWEGKYKSFFLVSKINSGKSASFSLCAEGFAKDNIEYLIAAQTASHALFGIRYRKQNHLDFSKKNRIRRFKAIVIMQNG